MKYIFTEIERKKYYIKIIFYVCVYHLITHTLVGSFHSFFIHFKVENDVRKLGKDVSRQRNQFFPLVGLKQSTVLLNAY